MNEGLALGHEAAERAADHAGMEFKDSAFTAVVSFSKRHKQFTMEEVRLASPNVPTPPDSRAWGHVALRAQREGVIRHAGFVRVVSKHCHGNRVSLWETVHD